MNKHFICYTKWATICNIILLLLILLCSMADANETAIKTIAYEASNQSFEGQVAVASVIKTRAFERNQTAEQVVLAPYQFSCWNSKTKQPTQKRNLKRQELDIAEKAWNKSKVWEFNHYARHDVKPYWIKHAKKSKRIGDHIFYQL